MKREKPCAILLLSCPDSKGIVASVSDFIYSHQGNIVHAAQHTTMTQKIFFMRIEWELEGFDLGAGEIGKAFEKLATKFKMRWMLRFTDQIPRMALFVSRHVHCFYDLLLRHQMGEIKAEIPLVISNHCDLKGIAGQFGLPYLHIPITAENKKRTGGEGTRNS